MLKGTAYLRRILKHTIDKLHYIIIISLVSGIAFYFGLYLVASPFYTADVSVYINNSLESDPEKKKNVTQTDLLVSEILVPTYMSMLRSNIALTDIAERSGLPGYTPNHINNAMYFSAVSGTAILRIYVNDTDPQNAATIANAVVGTLMEVISKQIEGSSVGVIDYASPPTLPSNQNSRRNAVYGMLTGFIFSLLYFNIKAARNAVIKTEDDLKRRLDLPVLGIIPYLKEDEDPKKPY